ncbi:MAG: Rnf-Nqr domain containing protein [Oscillospiraceae bacterium]|nr:Rnf-Nqr domain containing protein [Oscillospiraceae bacterium]
MIEVLRSGLATFFVYALAAIFAQNAVFSRSLGVSRLLKLVDDPAMDTLLFSGLLCIVQVLSSMIGYGLNQLFLPWTLGDGRWYLRPVLLVAATVITFFIVMFAVATIFKKRKSLTRVAAALPAATFNCCVLGTLLLMANKNYTLLQTLGFALGTAVGYMLAALLVAESQRTLHSRNLPQSFRGLPATLVYLGILALALYGFTGQMLTI